MTATMEPITEALVDTHVGSIIISGGPLAGTIEWDTSKPNTVEAARETFVKAKSLGMLTVQTSTKDGDVVSHQFTPDAEGYVITAPLVGG
jgi:hypothetical protein